MPKQRNKPSSKPSKFTKPPTTRAQPRPAPTTKRRGGPRPGNTKAVPIHSQRSVSFRAPDDLIEWLDQQAASLSMSRNNWLVLVLTNCMIQQKAMVQSGYQHHLDDVIEDRMHEAISRMKPSERIKFLKDIQQAINEESAS